MAQLPRVAVLGTGSVAGTALCALVDSGLDARLFLPAAAGQEQAQAAVNHLSGHGLGERATIFAGACQIRPVDDGHRPFDLQVGDQPATRQDVIVIAGDPTGEIPEPDAARALFGGTFDPWTEGVFRCGRTIGGGEARSAPSDTADAVTLAEAQSRWIGEYLRGRYLLPPQSAMLAAIGSPGRADPWPAALRDWLTPACPPRSVIDHYLRWLHRELRQGRARAARGGYPLPAPSLISLSADRTMIGRP